MGAQSTPEAAAQPHIRPATRADAAAIAAIYAPYVLYGTASFEIEPPDTDAMVTRIERCLSAGWPWLVLELDGVIAGYAYATQFRDRAAYAHTAETSIYLRQGLAGRGLGRLLLEALVDASAAAGFRQLIAVIGDSSNAASIGLHAAMGFRHVGTLRDVGLKKGRLLDVVYMQHSVDETGSSAMKWADGH